MFRTRTTGRITTFQWMGLRHLVQSGETSPNLLNFLNMASLASIHAPDK